MEKKYATLVATLVTLIVLGNYLFFNAGNIFPEREIVVIVRAIDGDTVKLHDGRTVRLLNINTPEKGNFGYDEATEFLRNYENKTVELEVEGVGRYGRILGRFFYKDRYINLDLTKLGLAHKYLVEEKEMGNFIEAEKEALEKNLGIWKKSEYYGCLSVEINKKEEYVIIEDKCDVSLAGWTIKDDTTKSYKFKSDIEGKFILYSEKGVNNETALYWGKGKIWNNDKDSIFIRDEKGYLVYYDSYGY